MRITFILPQPGLSGGIRVIAVYAERLKRRGHDVLLVHPPNAQPSFRARVRSLVRGQGWPRVPHVYPSHLDGLDVPRKLLDRWRPITAQDVPDADVVVATWWETAEWVSALPQSKGAKAYFIQHYEVHDNQPVERVKQTWSLPFHKIVVAQWLADIARDSYGDGDVSLVPNSVDLDVFHAPARGKQPAPTVGFMHAVVPWKGTDLACKGIRIARESIGRIDCVSFGMHPPTAAHPVPSDTRFTLLPGAEAIRDIYAQCDAWIVASRSEGFGLPILEAMACRTPVIATPTGAAPELVGQGGGILVNHESPRAIADAILRVARMSDAQWRAMSDRAYETARGYTWDDAVDRFEAALHAACAKSESRSRANADGAMAPRRREVRA
ncbi:MAG: glycosyltransferase family 4 protein [Candidatus Hydrogenedentes bacterium]|nr:glycosyltransferase family 4 protein [Candidatus Hydrogenedentota bacterium]